MVGRALATALAAVCLAVAGCGGSDDEPEPAKPAKAAKADSRAPQSVGPRIAGSVVQYADCDDWRRGTRREREATVDELRDQLTAQSQADTTSPLSDRRAYRILQKSCSQSYAGSLRLYKLFARAQGYALLGE